MQSGVISKIAFEVEFEKAIWQDEKHQWLLETSDGKYACKFVIFCTGPMHVPSFPNIKGLSSFPGEIFHSAQWDHDVDLTNKRVAVVGSGASAIQFVPEIQPHCQHLTLFQRTPPWVLPKRDFGIGSIFQSAFAYLPFLQTILRFCLFMVFEVLNQG